MTYYRSWNMTFKHALASNTANVECMRAFLRKREASLAYNKNMPDEIWWALAKSKTKAEMAEALASPKLTADRLDYLLSDKRAGVLTTIVSRQELSHAQVDRILGQPKQYDSVVRALSKAEYISAEQARKLLSMLDGWHWAQALKSQKALSDLEVSSIMAKIPETGNRVVLRYGHFVDEILDSRPALSYALLNDIFAEKEAWKSADLSRILSAIATCRHWKSGMSSGIRKLLGDTPKPSQQRAVILMGIFGNPNSGAEDVTWSQRFLYAWKDVLPLDMQEFILKVSRIREDHLIVPVTGKWESASGVEARAIKALRTEGLYSYYSHPRDGIDRSRKYAPDAPASVGHIGRLPVSLKQRDSWEAVSRWREGIMASAPYVDEALKGCGPVEWDTLITLSEDWEGDVDSLIQAATSI